jgi:hypothetical protein
VLELSLAMTLEIKALCWTNSIVAPFLVGNMTRFQEPVGEILGKSDDGSNDVTAENGSTLGSWSAMLDNVYSTIAVSLKSSTSYSTYLFTGVTTAELSGLFDTAGTSINQRGNAQALSHMTIAYYNAPTPEEPEAESVPEPGMVMGLLAMTTVGIGSLKSRRRDRC